MKKIRTIVVDDEPLARSRIINLLKKFDFVEIIGEGKNGREALQMMRDYQPDLLFLDIQMPDLNGFDVLANAGDTPLPFIIFVTAYDQYALQAFDVHAVDYLLKPYDDDRFTRALDHAQHQIQLRQNALLHQKVVQLIEDYQHQPEQAIQFIELKDKGINYRLKVDDLQVIEAHGNYLKLHLRDRFYLIRQTLQSMIDTLDRPYFLRIHRSILLNTHYLEQISYGGNNQYIFKMNNAKELLSSRSHKEEIDQFLKDETLRRNLFVE